LGGDHHLLTLGRRKSQTGRCEDIDAGDGEKGDLSKRGRGEETMLKTVPPLTKGRSSKGASCGKKKGDKI